MYDEIRKWLTAYYQQELNYTKVGLINEVDPVKRDKICWYALQRCLGACQFAQIMGLPFDVAEMLFETMRADLLKIELGG